MGTGRRRRQKDDRRPRWKPGLWAHVKASDPLRAGDLHPPPGSLHLRHKETRADATHTFLFTLKIFIWILRVFSREKSHCCPQSEEAGVQEGDPGLGAEVGQD